MSDDNKNENPYSEHKDNSFPTLYEETEIACHFAWKEGYLAGEKTRFTDEEKELWMWIFTCHEANKQHWDKAKWKVLESIGKKVIGEG